MSLWLPRTGNGPSLELTSRLGKAGKHRRDPGDLLPPCGLQIGLRNVWLQPAVFGCSPQYRLQLVEVCFDSITVLIRGRSCLQTLLWTLSSCFGPIQKLSQRRIFGPVLAGRNGISLSIPCAISQQEHRPGVNPFPSRCPFNRGPGGR